VSAARLRGLGAAVIALSMIGMACGSGEPSPSPTEATPAAPVTPPPSPTTRAAAPTTTGVTPTTTEPDLVVLGKSLAARNGCAACHSADGSALVGPTWLGLFGTEERFTDGSTAVVDEAYLVESIVDPNAKIVEGFLPDVMPKDFGDKLSDQDIEAIIAYIKSLSQ
jgi:cytochrome c oxidase subunit 2